MEKVTNVGKCSQTPLVHRPEFARKINESLKMHGIGFYCT